MNDITKPLRLAIGSHEAGSGKGCAMNVISWENGDIEITDYPPCTAAPLARLVQLVNDRICPHAGDGFLCPACSLTVLDLAHSVTGTAGAARKQQATWTAELLDSPEWGVSRLASGSEREAIVRVADMFRERAAGNEPSFKAWDDATVNAAARARPSHVAAYAAAHAAHSAYAVNPGVYAAYAAAAANATTTVAAANAAVGAYTGATSITARVEHCRSAIAAWHRICGTAPAVPEPAITELAVREMSAK